MAATLRPRRGKKASAESQAIVLKKGEIFFEVPDTGVGTGTGKIKMGDGTTAYSSLPYFLEGGGGSVDVSTSAITFTETTSSSSYNSTLLGKIVTGANLNIIIAAIKNLLKTGSTMMKQKSLSL